MNNSNLQIGGHDNSQSMVNDKAKKSWQDNIFLFVLISVTVAVIGIVIAKWLGY